MTTLADAFALAQKHVQAGELREAEQVYHQMLRADGSNAQVWCALGISCLRQHKWDEAIAALQQAVTLRPSYGEAHTQLGLALAEQGKLAEAISHYQKALRQNSDDVETRYHLGSAQAALGKLDQAVVSFSQVLRLRPDHVDGHTSLGIALARQGKREEAIGVLQQALRLRPDHAKAHNNLGVALAELGRHDEALACWREAVRLKTDYAEAYFNLAVTLGEQRKADEAILAYQQALRYKPDYAESYNNLGLALTEQGRHVEAVATLRQAIRLRPAYAEAWNNLALALVELGRYDETEASFAEALRINPAYVEAHNNLGTALAAMARTEEALATYQVALWLRTDYAEVHWNRALAWLQLGNYEQGWPEYEWRWRRKRARPRPFNEPAWDGSPLDGKTILVYSEQGLGDTLQFIRYLPSVKERGGRVVFECPEELVSLLADFPGIDRLVAEKTELPPFDVQVPLLSLPARLGTTLNSIPADVPYLCPKPDLVQRWRSGLGDHPAVKIGIIWQGNPRHRWDRHRSFPLRCFESIARLPGVRLYSLQKGDGCEQLKANAGRMAVTDLSEQLTTFMDTAAVMKNLDLVITCDTAPAHLAGALGVRVWVLLSFLVDWRWMHQRTDTPWYPTMRLFRQRELDRWDEVFGQLVPAVEQFVAERNLGRWVPVELAAAEFFDRIAVLEIESERTADDRSRRRLRAELARFQEAQSRIPRLLTEAERLVAELKQVIRGLADAEEAVRRCEDAGDFGPRFVELARGMAHSRANRADIKRRLMELLAPETCKDAREAGCRA